MALNILHTTHTYPPALNGVAQVVGNISTRLAANGHAVTVYTERAGGAPKEETRDGVHIRRFDNSGSLVAGIRGDTRPFLESVRSGRWDLIVMHCYQTWTTDLLLKELDRLAAPCIVVAHGLSGYPKPEFKDYYAWVAPRVSSLRATVGLSALLEDTTFARDNGLPLPRIIANGVDTEEWSRPAVGVRSRWSLVGHPWLLNVSNHNPNKGHERLWHVADRVRMLEPKAIVTIIGGRHPAARFNLGRIGVVGGCWYRCLATSVRRRGVRLNQGAPRSDVVSAVKEADVFLLTSRWEAYPVSLLESMAAGTPWVSFDVGCVREYKGGIVVGDIEEMAAVTNEILRRPQLRAALTEAGVAQIKAKHNWIDIAHQYELLYLECVSRV